MLAWRHKSAKRGLSDNRSPSVPPSRGMETSITRRGLLFPRIPRRLQITDLDVGLTGMPASGASAVKRQLQAAQQAHPPIHRSKAYVGCLSADRLLGASTDARPSIFINNLQYNMEGCQLPNSVA